jgi:signal peptidase I
MKNTDFVGRTILAAFVVALFIKVFAFDFMITQGDSMLPTLKNGRVLVINHLAYGLRLPWNGVYVCRWALPRTGDVIVFFTPLGELAVKRCTQMLEDDLHFIATGDNSVQSYDSRSYGPVPVANITGKALFTSTYPLPTNP